MTAWDWIIIGLYFLGLASVAWWSSRRQQTSADYFLAGRNVGFFAIGASLFASNIGSEHLVGLSGSGVASGMAMGHWEMHAWIILLLAWVFVPFYYRSGVYTMPEFLERRFSSKARWILSVVSLVAYVFTKVSVTVYAGGLVFKALLPDVFGTPEAAFWTGALATVVLTGIYTVFGGLRAVLYTDTAQTAVLLIGAIFITIFGLQALGADPVSATQPATVASQAATQPAGAGGFELISRGWGELVRISGTKAADFALWRPLSDPDFPWLGILIASPIVGIWYWCTDQYIVQRTLAAKTLRSARRGALWGAFLKVWPVLIFLVPGLIAYALHTKGGDFHIPQKVVEGVPQFHAGQPVLDGDQVFPLMIAKLLPTGLRGLVVAGLMAAIMSSLSSLFNSSASLFTVDIYEKIRPGKSERHLVMVGRVATGVVVLLGILWIPVMPLIDKGGLYKYLQSVQGYLAPPITAVFLLGLFWKRTNAHGAVWGLSVGFILGMAKLTIQAFFGSGADKISNPAVLAAIGDFNFLYFSGVLFAAIVGVVIVASLLTAPPKPEKIVSLTYATATDEDKKANRASWNAIDVLLTALVAGLVIGLYLYFSFWLG
jgi:SSS family solute:Na+ symporter